MFLNRWVGMHSGGTETHIKELASRLALLGHDVEIFTTKGEELKKYETRIKVRYVSKHLGKVQHAQKNISTYLNALLFVLRAFLKFLELRGRGILYDVVSVHFFTEAFFMRFMRKIFGIPYVFIFEGYSNLEAKEAKYANLQIAISRYIIKKCYENYRYEPVFLPKGVDRSRFNPNVDGSDLRKKWGGDHRKLVLTVCELQKAKDVPTLVSAARIVCENYPNIVFIVIGDGIDRKKIEKQIKDLGLLEKINLIGRIPFSSSELPKYYVASDLFVLPSLHEFSPVVLQEALSSGLPIISTAVGGIPELVGDCGILISPKQPDLLAEKILEAIRDDELRKRMRKKGLERAERYSWDNLVIEYEKAYKSRIYARACDKLSDVFGFGVVDYPYN